MGLKYFATCVLFLLVTPLLSGADNRHFEVQDWCFCRSTDTINKTPTNCLADPAEAKGKEKLFLWMRISVNENGIRYLHGLKKLPIYHAWGRNGWLEGKVIDIGIKNQDWKNSQSKIDQEIDLRKGSFDWRTFSEKIGYIYDGEHYVSVMDAERRSVVLSQDKYNAFKPSIRISKGNQDARH